MNLQEEEEEEEEEEKEKEIQNTPKIILEVNSFSSFELFFLIDYLPSF